MNFWQALVFMWTVIGTFISYIGLVVGLICWSDFFEDRPKWGLTILLALLLLGSVCAAVLISTGGQW
jgi:hypothetical protein